MSMNCLITLVYLITVKKLIRYARTGIAHKKLNHTSVADPDPVLF
jgi:hypothetical protein